MKLFQGGKIFPYYPMANNRKNIAMVSFMIIQINPDSNLWSHNKIRLYATLFRVVRLVAAHYTCPVQIDNAAYKRIFTVLYGMYQPCT